MGIEREALEPGVDNGKSAEDVGVLMGVSLVRLAALGVEISETSLLGLFFLFSDSSMDGEGRFVGTFVLVLR